VWVLAVQPHIPVTVPDATGHSAPEQPSLFD